MYGRIDCLLGSGQGDGACGGPAKQARERRDCEIGKRHEDAGVHQYECEGRVCAGTEGGADW